MPYKNEVMDMKFLILVIEPGGFEGTEPIRKISLITLTKWKRFLLSIGVCFILFAYVCFLYTILGQE